MMRLVRYIALAVALVAPVAAQAQSEQELYAKAKAEPQLTLYTGTLTEVIESLTKRFEAAYPGVKTRYWRGDTSQVTQRFETETGAGRPSADLTLLTDRQSKLLYAKGLIEPYKSRHIDAYPVELHGRDFAWTNYALTLASFAWNTQEVKAADAPKTWEDLLNPKWRGKLAMQDPTQAGGSAIWFVTMYELWPEQKWTDYMRALGQQRLRFGRYLQVQEMLASGEAAIQVAAYPNYIEPLKAKGGPAEWGIPDPVIYTGLSINLSKKAQAPNAAKLFIDFLMADATQDHLNALDLLPALKAKWPAGYAKLQNTRLYPQAHDLELQKFDFFQAKMKEFFTR